MGRGRRVRRDVPGKWTEDADRIERVAQSLREQTQRSKLEFALAVGQTLIDAFFSRDGVAVSAEAVRLLIPEHASYRALARRSDHGLSAATLLRCLQVTLQHPVLPSGLSFTHRRALAQVTDDSAARRLAEDALANGWTSRRTESEVASWRARHQPVTTGRPRRPPALRRATTLGRAVRNLESSIGPDDLSANHSAELALVLQELGDRLHTLARMVTPHTNPVDSEGGG